MEIEAWRPCPIFGDRYDISSHGRVRSAKGVKALHTDKDGYPTVNLHREGTRKAANVHRLVCRAFHGEPVAPWREAAHLDGDRTNCRADNLKWVGKNQNHSHRKAHGTWPTGERHPRARLTEVQVAAIRKCRGAVSATDTARQFSISRHTVCDIWRGKRWPHESPVA